MRKKYYKIIPFHKISVVLLGSLLALSCATKPGAYKDIDSAVLKNDFNAAIEAVKAGQEAKKPIYVEKNAIMLFLDKGLLEYYAKDYTNSSQDLQEAERLIEEAFTKSISANFMSYIANDNSKEYPGEDFEDIYLNVFNALNYYNKGDIEGALVEIRKLSISGGKLNMLARKYDYKDPSNGENLEQIVQKQARTSQLPKGKPVEFSNSALARYLSALFYLGDGNTDSARIEFQQIPAAFAANSNIYQNPVPKAVEEARVLPRGKARLNIIGFSGLSPIKVEEIVVHYFPFFQNAVLHATNFKLPKLVPRPSVINRIEVIIDGKNKFELELLEDMGSVIEETFAVRYANIVLKTYIRTLIKYTAADVAARVASEKQGALAGLAIALSTKKTFEATESADIRMSRYLPNKAYIGGINLDPGSYNVTVNFLSGGNVVESVEHKNFLVKGNTLNLIDVASLK